MRKCVTSLFLWIFMISNLLSQNTIKGVVRDDSTNHFLQDASVSIQGTDVSTVTDASGVFTLKNVSIGKHVVLIRKINYEPRYFPVQTKGYTVDLGTILMYKEEPLPKDDDISTITITDDELNDESSLIDNISGLLQASKDVYLRTAAFEWSSSFYNIRGLNSENGKVLINGIEMNKLYNGRPQWSNWGGLNDVFRNQEFNSGFMPSDNTFGGVLGTTNINTRASEYRVGGKVAYASSNRSYVHRLMASYASGMTKNNWAFTVSASRRAGKEGFVDGTSYNANAVFIAVEKKINDKHSLNLTSIYAQNKRGKSSPNTQEIYDIKGIKYNPYWGYQNGKIRNSRIKRVEEPIIMLNHYWNISDKTYLNTNIAYQFGEIGNSRLDFNGGNDPSPTYYQKLPSYYLWDAKNTNYAGAYKSLKNLENNGQINWNDLYEQNTMGSTSDSKYILYEDRNDDKQFTINTILDTEITKNITLNGKLEYKKLTSDNFANVLDLLGGTGYVDINKFGKTTTEKQSDLQNPNRIVGVGDKFKYHYKLYSEVYGGFAQLQFKGNKKTDFYVAASIYNTTHQREGLFKTGYYPTNSLGKSKKLNFLSYGLKGGLTYKINGRHFLNFNGGYVSKAPILRNSFSNARSNNLSVADISHLENEKIISFDASYILRSPIVQAKITGYFTDINDATNISFFFFGGTAAFLQEVVTDINKRHFGTELGIEVKLTPSLTLKSAANIGQYTYNNNPNLVVTSDSFDKVIDYGKANLKNYKVASGPQKAYSLGVDYRDPDYWWVGITGNYFDNTYVNISPIKRTKAFVTDADGSPFLDYDPALAKKLLAQERFNSYFTLNAIGGKSWKVGNYKYIGVFASVSNILNKQYKTGGYEYARAANYQLAKDDNANNYPRFGNRYWYGRGTTYFINVNYRF